MNMYPTTIQVFLNLNPMKYFMLINRYALEKEREALGSCIHGYHVYQDIWTFVIGEEFTYI